MPDTAVTATPNPVLATVGAVLGPILNDPAVKASLIQALLSWIGGLFKHKTPAPPSVPVLKPTPAPIQPDPSFPDDHIPRPVTKLDRVTIGLSRVQLSKARHPEAYTEENPFGLMDAGPIQRGETAMPFDSKFWVTVSGFVAGKETTYADNLTAGRAYKTEIRVGDAKIVGHGPDPAFPNRPAAGYEMVGIDGEIGLGITAWGGDPSKGIESTSLGFLEQFQAFGGADGKTYRVSGSVEGIEAENPFTIRVS